MKKVVFYQIVSVVLTLIIAFLLYAVNQKDKHPRHRNPRSKVIKRLNFDEEQIASYDELIKQHEKDVDELDRKINHSKKTLYESLNNYTINNDSLIETIGATQMQIEKVHLNHFQKIKDICRKDQLEDYRLLTKDLVKVFNKDGPRSRGKRRRCKNCLLFLQ